ncbi:hypothetical protein M3Y97_00877500 [Aphelenchoides bicaudatus]|nr:hypothetical protein M3Y97_00877500 [Aphelenchoides bicaudatus]
MPERRQLRNHNELVLLEVLENALLQGAPQRRPTTKLCLASAAALLLASQTPNLSNSELGVSLAATDQMTMIELTDVEIQQLKEQNHRRIKRVVTVVAVTLMLISFILVALSLSLGPKIDQLVSENLETNLSSKDLFLGPKKNETI